MKLLTRLRLDLSHFHDHKFKHSFHNLLTPICNYRADIKRTPHYFLHCPLLPDKRLILTNNILINILNLNDSRSSEVLLLVNSSFKNTKNTSILNTTVDLLSHLRNFDVPFVTPDRYNKPLHSCMAVSFTSYNFYFYFSFFH